MCKDCGCSQPLNPASVPGQRSQPATLTVPLMRHLHEHNDRLAAELRQRFDEQGVLVLNLMSSPGAGKTRLLEQTVARLLPRYRCAVLEGDLETDLDARRLQSLGVDALQITTGSACHLDASHVSDAIDRLSLDDLDILFIENVGNLVCPASFDLGQHANVILLATTEGDDKPAKYPVMFRAADLVLINKTDLLPHLPDFSLPRARDYLSRVAGRAPVLEISASNGTGLDGWYDWLERARQGATAPARGSADQRRQEGPVP